MPNFHTHWLVAHGAISSAPEFVQAGADAYLKAASKFRKKLQAALEKPSLRTVESAANDARRQWNKDLEKKKDKEAITCFSAYMLGACGPDFWTLPSGTGSLPDTADFLFNLGHYNRTHRQFQVSVSRPQSREGKLKALAEQAYFCGMATHVAADLVIHQLVNVSAGAYNLLRKHWVNEQLHEATGPVGHWLESVGAAFAANDGLLLPASSLQPPTMSFQEEFADSGLTKFWTMHNKVEHYWDTYVRYRYLGDHGPVYLDERDKDGAFGRIEALGLPTVEGLLKEILKENKDPPKHVREYLSRRETRFLIEKPLCFPQIYCDRATSRGGDLDATTLYEIVATKANPVSDLHPELVKERGKLGADTSDEDMKGGSEKTKLDYFTSETNDHGDRPISWNYLTYFVCPDLAKVQKYGADFYDPRALVEFVSRATGVASAFVGELAEAYASAANPKDPNRAVDHPDKVRLGRLGNFWNLDTGLGLKVQCLGGATPQEAVTRLDFVHVLDLAGGGQGRIEIAGERPFLAGKESVSYEKGRSAKSEQVVLDGPPSPTGMAQQSKCKPETLLAPGVVQRSAVDCPTEKLLPQPKLVVRDPKPRLSLWLRLPIARLARDGGLGYFLHTDERNEVSGAIQQKAGRLRHARRPREMTEEWLETAYLIDGGTDSGTTKPGRSAVRNGSLQVFSTALRMSLDPADRTFWSTDFVLGRNYAVGTGRRSVLHPVKVNGAFDPKEQLAHYEEVSPTEQVFFSLHVIVKQEDGRVFDVLSGEEIKKKGDYDKLCRIDAAGFVKIVLHYETRPRGILHFEACFVDGLEVPVDFTVS